MPTSTARRVRSLLAVDQQLGEGATLRVAPELSDPVGSLEVGEHEDVEQLGGDQRVLWRVKARIISARCGQLAINSSERAPSKSVSTKPGAIVLP